MYLKTSCNLYSQVFHVQGKNMPNMESNLTNNVSYVAHRNISVRNEDEAKL